MPVGHLYFFSGKILSRSSDQFLIGLSVIARVLFCFVFILSCAK